VRAVGLVVAIALMAVRKTSAMGSQRSGAWRHCQAPHAI